MDQLKANTDFAAHLVGLGACSREIADEMVARSSESWEPLGMILVRKNKLRMRQLGEILSRQADDPRSLFGDVAVSLGHCTRADVEEAMQYQNEMCPHVLDLALEDERIDREKLIHAMGSYIRYVERLLDRLDDAVVQTPLAT